MTTDVVSAGTPVHSTPNCVPTPTAEPSDCNGKTVIAAGCLVAGKGYGQLIRAFALVTEERPD